MSVVFLAAFICLITIRISAQQTAVTTVYMSDNKNGLVQGNSFRVEPTPRILYDNNMNHTLTIAAADVRFKYFHLAFYRFDMEKSSQKANATCVDWIRLHDGDSLSSPVLWLDGQQTGNSDGRLCGDRRDLPADSVNSSTSKFTIHISTDSTAKFKGFEIITTAFSKDSCSSSDFSCVAGSMCIDGALRCNEVRNCADGSDELSQSCSAIQQSRNDPWQAIIIGSSLGGILLLCVLVAIGLWIRRQLRIRDMTRKQWKLEKENTYPITEKYHKSNLQWRLWRSEKPILIGNDLMEDTGGK